MFATLGNGPKEDPKNETAGGQNSEVIGKNIFRFDLNKVYDENYCKLKATQYLNLLQTKLPYGIFKELNYLFLINAQKFHKDWEVSFRKRH